MIAFILQVLETIVFAYFAASTIYLVVLAVAGRMKVKPFPAGPESRPASRIAILIPAYREDQIIMATATGACSHDYNKDRFHVVVIADQLQQTTLMQLRSLPISVIEIEEEISMKSKALLAGIHSLAGRGYDIAMILDADNVMMPGCLKKVDAAFQAGYQAVQCHRAAKNSDTPVALLDAISEAINVNIFRRGPFNLGLSAAPMGSGMAFNFELLAEILDGQRILNEPGEDREIDMQLMKRDIQIAFLNDAGVLDEKVSNAGKFQTQRTRWLEAQYSNFRRFFHPDMRVKKKSAAYYHRFFQTLLLPRLLYFVLVIFVGMALAIFIVTGKSILFIHPFAWATVAFAFLCALIISVPGRFFTIKTLQAMTQIPLLIASMLRAIFNMRRDRKTFLHTHKDF